jgi:hypothetical protein
MWDLIESLFPWSERLARERILAGHPPHHMKVKGRLNLANRESVRSLPERLEALSVDLSGCVHLQELPKALHCASLRVARTSVECLPQGLNVSHVIDAEDCPRLRIVEPLRVEQLDLRGCRALEHLAEGLSVERLAISDCPRVTKLPKSVVASVVRLEMSNCEGFKELPGNFAHLQMLDVSGCTRLLELPAGIRIRSRIELAGSSLRSLPWSLRSVRIGWRGMEVSDRIAFDPESITVAEVLGEINLAMRSVLLDRMGIERFVRESRALVADSDHDSGGNRRLLRIPFQNGEDFVCLDVRCPSTGKQYFLRVPPATKNCRQGAAWIAGFSDPADYQPIAET